MATSSPLPATRMRQICNDACGSALATATRYEHSSTADWNSVIINTILKSLISETSTTSSSEQTMPSRYKFAVNSTIVQHLSDPRPGGENGSPQEKSNVGRRGMHSASGAYWNNERDGMWSHKYEASESKGMDIVISVMWIAF